MRRFWQSRVGPPFFMLTLVLVAMVPYSMHVTTSNDPQDIVHALSFGLLFYLLSGYLLVRTKVWRPQILGAICILIGQGTFYGIIGLGRIGWLVVDTEIPFDVVRATNTVGFFIMIFGVFMFERAERKGQRVDVGFGPTSAPEEPKLPVVVYDRRSGKDRREGWGKLDEST